jgi:hypothetical protein
VDKHSVVRRNFEKQTVVRPRVEARERRESGARPAYPFPVRSSPAPSPIPAQSSSAPGPLPSRSRSSPHPLPVRCPPLPARSLSLEARPSISVLERLPEGVRVLRHDPVDEALHEVLLHEGDLGILESGRTVELREEVSLAEQVLGSGGAQRDV